MTIKELFDAEKWDFAKAMLMHRHGFPAKEHNASLVRIEDAMANRIAELEGAFEAIAKYARIERLDEVTDIISGMLNKEENKI